MISLFTTLLTSCILLASEEKQTPNIEIPCNKNVEITVDGNTTESDWKKATRISTFINPWNLAVEPATEVSLLWNGKEIYFSFTASDKETVLVDQFTEEHDVSKEDRVEFFFSPELPLTDYYAIEMDPLGRILDYKVGYYRKFDESWNAGKRIRVKGTTTPGKFCVEGCISSRLLKEMTKGKKDFYLGIYRAEFNKDSNGKLIYNWLCIRDPHLAQPDFHVEETFIRVSLK